MDWSERWRCRTRTLAAKWSLVISGEGKEGMIFAAPVQHEVMFICKAP